MMNRRFKLIHYYDASEDTVHIIDIWDTRMNLNTIVKRIKIHMEPGLLFGESKISPFDWLGKLLWV